MLALTALDMEYQLLQLRWKDLADCIKKQVPKTKNVISGVLYWTNIRD